MSQAEPNLGAEAFPSPRLYVNVVLFTIEDRALKVLTIEKGDEPFEGCHVLPGDQIRPGETLQTTARRVLADQLGLIDLGAEQLHTFSAVDRDPRGWSVATAYLMLAPYDMLHAVAGDIENLRLPEVIADDETGTLRLKAGDDLVRTGFDHDRIIHTGLLRLRDMLDRSSLSFDLLPRRFTLYELQQAHEAILGRPLNKPHFRKKWHDRQLPDGSQVTATGQLTSGRSYRPAELYRVARAKAG